MLTLEYLAGLFDGEGSVSLAKRTRKGIDLYIPVLTCSNTCRSVLVEMQNRLEAGSVDKGSLKSNHRVYGWHASNAAGYRAAKILRRHTYIKSPQLDLVIRFYEQTLNMTKGWARHKGPEYFARLQEKQTIAEQVRKKLKDIRHEFA